MDVDSCCQHTHVTPRCEHMQIHTLRHALVCVHSHCGHICVLSCPHRRHPSMHSYWMHIYMCTFIFWTFVLWRYTCTHMCILTMDTLWEFCTLWKAQTPLCRAVCIRESPTPPQSVNVLRWDCFVTWTWLLPAGCEAEAWVFSPTGQENGSWGDAQKERQNYSPEFCPL